MNLSNRTEVEQFVRDSATQDSTRRMEVARMSALHTGYFLGHQWTTDGGIGFTTSTSGRLYTSFSPDSRHLRVQDNQLTMRAIASAAATHPGNFEALVAPPDRDCGVVATVHAQTLEDTLGAAMRASGYVDAARRANFMRCIDGCAGVGLAVKVQSRPLRGGGIDGDYRDCTVTAFPFHPMRLILDPANTSRNLNLHDFVVYQDVWTIKKLRRYFPGVKFDEDEMRTVAQLAHNEIQLWNSTRLPAWQQYAMNSNTKAAIVYQVHVKDDTGDRFGRMYACIDGANREKEMTVVNMDDPTTPFGGNGLGLTLVQGHDRPESAFGIGDVAMMREDQDRINLLATATHRIIQKYAGYQIWLDRRWMGKQISDEDARNQFHNTVAGIVIGNPTSNDRSISPPQMVQTPPPQPFLGEMIGTYSQAMSAKSFTPDQARGFGIKTHVPDAAYERLLAEGGRVHDTRVRDDVAAHEQLLTALLGTTIRHVHETSPSTIAMLQREGFDEQDLAVLMAADPSDPGKVTIPEGSIRQRSNFEKREALSAAVEAQAIAPEEYRKGLAGLDMAVSDDDRFWLLEAGKATERVILGEEWQPLPLGNKSAWIIADFEKALMDRRVRDDPEARDRLVRALVVQKQAVAEEQMLAQGPQPGAMPAEPAPAQPSTIGEMLDMAAA